jgi:hypothetical protein
VTQVQHPQIAQMRDCSGTVAGMVQHPQIAQIAQMRDCSGTAVGMVQHPQIAQIVQMRRRGVNGMVGTDRADLGIFLRRVGARLA